MDVVSKNKSESRQKGLFKRFLSCWTRFFSPRVKNCRLVCKLQPNKDIALILSSSRRRKDRSDGRARDFLHSFEFPPLCHSLEASKIGVGSRLIAGSGSFRDISATVCVAQSAWDIPYLNRKIFLFHYQIFKSHFFLSLTFTILLSDFSLRALLGNWSISVYDPTWYFFQVQSTCTFFQVQT